MSVAFSVTLSVFLISVAFGVHDQITSLINDPHARALVNSDRITRILVQLTVAVTTGLAIQAAATTFILGQNVMGAQREKVRLRREQGAYRSTLLWELMRSMAVGSVGGAVDGELAGIASAVWVRDHTALPATFNALSLFTGFPLTITLAWFATLVPAWVTANQAPGLVRNEY